MSDADLISTADMAPSKLFKDLMVDRLCIEANFSKTRDFGHTLAGSYSKYLSATDVNRILECASKDGQISGYYYSDRILKNLYRNTKDRLFDQTAGSWRRVCENGVLNELRTFLIQEGVLADENTGS